jgi:hypothetical protein
MPSAKKVLRKFLNRVANAPDGALLEVGIMYDVTNGWRVYERIGDAAIGMAPAQARQLADTYDEIGHRPEWRGVRHGLEETLGLLRPLADEADEKNRNKVVPPGYAEAMPTMGSA